MTGSRRSDALASASRIVAAAKRRLRAQDGAEVSLSRIADDAGVGVATLYRHFPNRQALARAVFEEVFSTEVEPVLARLAEGDAPREQVLGVLERLSAVIQEQRALAEPLGGLAEASLAYLRPRAGAFAPYLRAAQAAGNVRDDLAPEDVAHLFAAMISAGPAIGDDPGTRRRYHSLLLDALNPASAEALPDPRPPSPTR